MDDNFQTVMVDTNGNVLHPLDLHIKNHLTIGNDSSLQPIIAGCWAFRLASNFLTNADGTFSVCLSDSPAIVTYDELESVSYTDALDPDATFLTNKIEEGDILSIINDAKRYNVFTVTAVNGNGITFTTTNTDILTLANYGEPEFDEYTIFCIKKPTIGLIDITNGSAIAFGLGAQATGLASFSSGGNNQAYGNYSFTTGRNNKAGYASLATGRSNEASGEQAFTSGSNCIASANHSFASGYSCKATAQKAHAEGEVTQATGVASHAEGNSSKANNDYSHAEGWNCKTIGQAAHAEGKLTAANGSQSHAEGEQTIADHIGSHAEGYMTQAKGKYSHSEGASSQSTGMWSHAENENCISAGTGSHAEGYNTYAGSDYSHTSGMGTVTKTLGGQMSVGRYNVDDATKMFIVGWGNVNGRRNVFAVGDGYISIPVFNEDGTSANKMCNIKAIQANGKITLEIT